jgi:hypothetical protein
MTRSRKGSDGGVCDRRSSSSGKARASAGCGARRRSTPRMASRQARHSSERASSYETHSTHLRRFKPQHPQSPHRIKFHSHPTRTVAMLVSEKSRGPGRPDRPMTRFIEQPEGPGGPGRLIERRFGLWRWKTWASEKVFASRVRSGWSFRRSRALTATSDALDDYKLWMHLWMPASSADRTASGEGAREAATASRRRGRADPRRWSPERDSLLGARSRPHVLRASSARRSQ